ncbi:nitrogen fixation protein NifH [Candidatus Altiarchaeales archaeon WOR_SM1_SCG]|nr:nitrogen fixation protein NifH [Candidatus Altiarchaeales archaeon WOR_SM1_SCG]
MNNWKSLLKAVPTDWLLEKDNPSVRYFTLINILEKPENDPEVMAAKQEIMKTGVVPKILANQKDEGNWENPGRFYTAKYRGTVWQLLILAELGADEENNGIKKACEFILENSQDPESGGFSMWVSAKKGGGRHSGVIPCLTGNMVYSLIKFGYLEDYRVRHAINWITTYQRFDDGTEKPPTGWPYDKAFACWGKHSCHMGVVKTLKALAEIPHSKKSGDVENTIELGAEYMLKHHIHKRSHDLNRVSKPGWLRFGFPLMYQTDALEILGILTNLGYRDERMQEAVDLVVSKQDEQGRWKLENTFNGRFQINIEQKGKPSKWITLRAMSVIKRFYSE